MTLGLERDDLSQRRWMVFLGAALEALLQCLIAQVCMCTNHTHKHALKRSIKRKPRLKNKGGRETLFVENSEAPTKNIEDWYIKICCYLQAGDERCQHETKKTSSICNGFPDHLREERNKISERLSCWEQSGVTGSDQKQQQQNPKPNKEKNRGDTDVRGLEDDNTPLAGVQKLMRCSISQRIRTHTWAKAQGTHTS